MSEICKPGYVNMSDCRVRFPRNSIDGFGAFAVSRRCRYNRFGRNRRESSESCNREISVRSLVIIFRTAISKAQKRDCSDTNGSEEEKAQLLSDEYHPHRDELDISAVPCKAGITNGLSEKESRSQEHSQKKSLRHLPSMDFKMIGSAPAMRGLREKLGVSP